MTKYVSNDPYLQVKQIIHIHVKLEASIYGLTLWIASTYLFEQVVYQYENGARPPTICY